MRPETCMSLKQTKLVSWGAVLKVPGLFPICNPRANKRYGIFPQRQLIFHLELISILGQCCFLSFCYIPVIRDPMCNLLWPSYTNRPDVEHWPSHDDFYRSLELCYGHGSLPDLAVPRHLLLPTRPAAQQTRVLSQRL